MKKVILGFSAIISITALFSSTSGSAMDSKWNPIPNAKQKIQQEMERRYEDAHNIQQSRDHFQSIQMQQQFSEFNEYSTVNSTILNPLYNCKPVPIPDSASISIFDKNATDVLIKYLERKQAIEQICVNYNAFATKVYQLASQGLNAPQVIKPHVEANMKLLKSIILNPDAFDPAKLESTDMKVGQHSTFTTLKFNS